MYRFPFARFTGAVLAIAALSGGAALAHAETAPPTDRTVFVQGRTYQTKNAVFCVNSRALFDLVAARRSRDFDKLPSGCFADRITYVPQARVAQLSVFDRTVFLDKNGQNQCTFKNGTAEQCRVEWGPIGFVLATMHYREKVIRIYIAVDDALDVVGSDGKPIAPISVD
jgi:hypothetical protein